MTRKKTRTPLQDWTILSPLQKDILSLLDETVTIRDSAGSREITKSQAVQRKTLETALKGSPHAQRHILDLFREAQAADQARIKEDLEIWQNYVVIKRRKIKLARQERLPDPESLPHPDDIVFDTVHGVTIAGPITKEELREVRRAGLLRDALLYQDAMERSLDRRRRDPKITHGDPVFVAILINKCLPKRFQLSESVFVGRRLDLCAMTGRELLRETRAAWKRCGVPLRRGQRIPPPEIWMAYLDEIKCLMRESFC